MRVRREIEVELHRAARAFPAVVLTGPRRAGKTTCLRHAFPHASYHLLEDPDVLARVRADPRGWLDDVRLPAILDEVQGTPDLLRYVRSRIDAAPTRRGQWLLTGSQDFALMQGVTESMAGRAAVLHLLPFSVREVGRWDLVRGAFPEAVARPRSAATWYRSYVQTYLERDVRAVTAVRDLAKFRRFLALVATRSGQLLNKTDLAAPLGVSVPTITQWLSVLETTGLLIVVPPWFESLGKRLVKSPKIYLADSGLLCHLLGFETRAALERSAFAGPVFESFVASELVKEQIHRGRPKELYGFRDQQGLEVDFVVPTRDGELELVEARYAQTVTPGDARALSALLPRIRDRRAHGVVVHRSGKTVPESTALAPSVQALTVEQRFGA